MKLGRWQWRRQRKPQRRRGQDHGVVGDAVESRGGSWADAVQIGVEPQREHGARMRESAVTIRANGRRNLSDGPCVDYWAGKGRTSTKGEHAGESLMARAREP